MKDSEDVNDKKMANLIKYYLILFKHQHNIDISYEIYENGGYSQDIIIENIIQLLKTFPEVSQKLTRYLKNPTEYEHELEEMVLHFLIDLNKVIQTKIHG